MTQPSYPHTIELPHSSLCSSASPRETGADLASTDMAPAEDAAPGSHANDSPSGQAGRSDTKAVNRHSLIRKEDEAGPGGPHHP